MEGTGEELAGVTFPLMSLEAGVLDATDEGVAERFGSTLRFFAGGAFFVAVAVPFFFAGAGRFFGFVASSAAVSVEGTGTEDSRSGDCVRALCSVLSVATVLFA